MHTPDNHTILAFDIGTRRTGVAICHPGSDMAIAKDTINHRSIRELLESILLLMQRYDASLCVLGLPRLPGGEEGEQSAFVRSVGAKLAQKGREVSYIDERYTTTRNSQYDGNAAAACAILNTYLDQKRNLT